VLGIKRVGRLARGEEGVKQSSCDSYTHTYSIDSINANC